ncbi:MAG: ThiF family adenylyltransferase [Candidatus Hodarchaeota archaeon]
MGKKKKKGVKEGDRNSISSANLKLHPEAECASKIIQSHNAVGGNVESPQPLADGGFRIKFNMNVSLPSRANTRGISETGVQLQEPVIFRFPLTFPFHAPVTLLRPNFNKSLPHINPIPNRDEKDYVLPCIYYGPLDDLLHQEGDGLSEILNQLSDWLGKAAINDLINPKQGWEPIRRDNTFGWMVYDLSRLRTLIPDKEGALVFQCRFLKELGWKEKPYFVWVIDHEKPCNITPALVRNSFFAEKGTYGTIYGSLMILVWSDSKAIIDRYLPENIRDLHLIYERAKDYCFFDALWSVIADFGWAFKEASLNIPNFPLFIILCVRRPFALIGDDSKLELIPYMIDCHIEDGRSPFLESGIRIREDSPVLSLGHRHKVNRKLLQRMSGGKEVMNRDPIVHIGCGSVGSKIAMHLARAGHGPFKLVDKEAFSPHNVARHALTPIPEFPGQPKASLLAREIELLRLEAEPINEDIIKLCKNPDNKMNPFPNDSRLVIESTGSVAVRNMLASLPDGKLGGRLLHVALYQQGKVGIMAIEGSGRNPNVNDLVIGFWDELIDDPNLRSKFSSFSGEMRREEIGLGCGSHTMVVSDTRISLFAAGIAERARQIIELENSKFQDGELWIGALDENELGVSWKLLKIGKTTILRVKAQNLWKVRILTQVVNQITDETKEWGDIETGGVLIGRISLSNRSFTISRVLEAPTDSTRSENSFVLGVEGLKKKVQEIYDKSAGTLNYVGTWHSHPKGGEASSIDKDSLEQIRRLRFGAPAIGLIWTPSGFRATIDEGKLA